MLAVLIADQVWHSRVVTPIVAGLAAGLSSYMTDLILVALFRPKILRFVNEHQSDITSVA